MKDLQKHVGERIRAIREQKGISQETLADLCNLHRTYIGLIERGQRNLTISSIEKIARALEVSPAKFFEDTEERLPAKRTKSNRAAIRLGDLAAHVAAIRTVIINAELVSEADYDALVVAQK
jgi:transcriptional regulator with XRE-family HTH domain